MFSVKGALLRGIACLHPRRRGWTAPLPRTSCGATVLRTRR